jgi:hypothetical protein
MLAVEVAAYINQTPGRYAQDGSKNQADPKW